MGCPGDHGFIRRSFAAALDGLRVALEWTAIAPLDDELKVSVRALDLNGMQIATADAVPVHFAYPTTAWVPGEIVKDVHDVPLPRGSKSSAVLVILYRAADGSEVGRQTFSMQE